MHQRAGKPFHLHRHANILEGCHVGQQIAGGLLPDKPNPLAPVAHQGIWGDVKQVHPTDLDGA